jgi:hypothetical protein
MAVEFKDYIVVVEAPGSSEGAEQVIERIKQTQANRSTVEAMAVAPQSDRLAKNPRAPQFAFLEKGRRVLSDGTQRLELIDIGPNPHAKEMVIAYLPKQRIVFQGDLFFMPVNDAPAGPPQATTVSFARKVGELKLQFDRIASVHGRTATKQEFEKAMGQQPST